MTTQNTGPYTALTPQVQAPPSVDAGRLEQIRNSMDPLAIVGVFIYYITKDLTGYQFSQDTLLWFIAAASGVRSMITRWIDRKIKERHEQREHERAMAQAIAHAQAVSAARDAAEGLRKASGVMQAIIAVTPGAEMQGTGESQISERPREDTTCD